MLLFAVVEDLQCGGERAADRKWRSKAMDATAGCGGSATAGTGSAGDAPGWW